MTKLLFYVTCFLTLVTSCKTEKTAQEVVSADTAYNEPHRPQLHFSPKQNWMNDPNGMVYHNGEYHLFYQHHPSSNVWGPMHWGHAVSKDLVQWEHLPIALYPDSLGMIFSGGAVFDKNNSSGFGTKENPPLVAMFTYHSQEKEKAGAIDYQNQGIAYSIDNGRTWTKYENNPVLKNQGIKDFRDPKVFWHDDTNQWIVILAVKDHIELWSSPNLKDWKKLSDFGSDYGGHGGVWECPDLFQLTAEGDAAKKWVMLVSINPGGPNGGSATQYFTGDFDGKVFKADLDKSVSSWLDYGPDNYAGVTFSNVDGERKIFLGWMSNWAYAQEVPTTVWRSAMTLPRDLSLQKIGNRYFVKSELSAEVNKNAGSKTNLDSFSVSDSTQVNDDAAKDVSKSIITATVDAKDFAFVLSNKAGNKVRIGYEAGANRFFIDRSKSGNVGFSKGFTSHAYAPRVANASTIDCTIVVDVSSVEVFFDDGLSVMTAVFFPDSPLTNLGITGNGINVNDLGIQVLQPIW